MQNPPILSVEHFSRQLANRWLWKDLSFSLTAGDCLGLVAPSGAGKTLLMRNLVLLDPIQQGTLLFQGQSPTDWTLPVYRTQVMYLPQRATAFEGTVVDNLKRAFTLGVYHHRQFNPAQIENWLHQLGRRADFLQRQATQLSGGETQILALLRTLQLEPQVLLLDEPTASLDANTTLKVEALLHTWLNQPGRTCLVASHDVEQMSRMTNRQLSLTPSSARQ
jgi:putative ABC transport system ATP-binding protein